MTTRIETYNHWPIVIPAQFPPGQQSLLVQTTNAVPKLVFTYNVPSQNGLYLIGFNTIAASSDGADYGLFDYDPGGGNRASGTFNFLGPLAPKNPSSGAGPTYTTWAIIFANPSPNVVTISIQGAAGVTVNWNLFIQIASNTFASSI